MKINISTRFLFGLIFLPAVLLSLALASAFTTSCMQQLEYSSHVKILLVPLAIANFDNWFIVILLSIALLAIIWPIGGPHPVLAFGASFFIIFPATFSIFVGAEIHFSTMRYTKMLGSNEIAIATTDQRLLTQDMLISLRDFFQNHKEFKCCGLQDYNYYCPSNATVMVSPDGQHDVNMKMKIPINRVDYLAGQYGSGRRNKSAKELKNSEYKLDPGTFPSSCCNGNTCKSNCKPGDHMDVHPKGCSKYILKPLDPCIRVIPISYVFPWIAVIYASIFSWAHLRKSQGVGVMEFGSIKKVPSMPLADPEEFEKKDLSEVTKPAESVVGESKNLTPKENVSKTPSNVLTPGTVQKTPSKLVTPSGGAVPNAPSKLLTLPGRRNSKLSAKIPSYSKMK